jgi:hypothetical protein
MSPDFPCHRISPRTEEGSRTYPLIGLTGGGNFVCPETP